MKERLQEIERRLSEIKVLLDNSDADIEALTEETDLLIEERKKIIEKGEKRKKLLDNIIEEKEFLKRKYNFSDEKNQKKEDIDRGNAEYRSAFLKKLRGLDLNEKEKRAFAFVSENSQAVIPTQTGNEILTKIKQYAPLLDKITLLNVSGNVKFAVEDEVTNAEIHVEGSEITASNDTLKTVSLTGYEITKYVKVSKTVSTMSIDSFENWLTDLLSRKLAEKINALIINGTGTEEPTGIDKAITWDATNSVTVAKEAKLSSDNVLTLVGLLPGHFDKSAEFVMSKKTLFTKFMPLQDNSKNKLVTNEGNEYYVYGYHVMLDEEVKLGEAYLGDFGKICGNLPENITITSDYELKTNSFEFLGCAIFDSKIADTKAFVKLIQSE